MMKKLNDSLCGRVILLIFWTTFFCATITGVVMSIPIILAFIKQGFGLLV